jgi:hypothetical protein
MERRSLKSGHADAQILLGSRITLLDTVFSTTRGCAVKKYEGFLCRRATAAGTFLDYTDIDTTQVSISGVAPRRWRFLDGPSSDAERRDARCVVAGMHDRTAQRLSGRVGVDSRRTVHDRWDRDLQITEGHPEGIQPLHVGERALLARGVLVVRRRVSIILDASSSLTPRHPDSRGLGASS